MLIDTHCHLDAVEFDADRDDVASSAFRHGVTGIVIPSVARSNFDSVIRLCCQYENCAYALGVHPMYVNESQGGDIEILKSYVENYHPVAIGEIGLDYFVTKDNIERQSYFFTEKLKLAKHYDLPVILHVRNAIDDILKKKKGAIERAHDLLIGMRKRKWSNDGWTNDGCTNESCQPSKKRQISV